ncbi:calcitonin receptor [Platysternon megacephalum]|uniref:Calcitonin receptor n=1 Tax=Platysternon megacephalum TaxID=55544 RepID=A0A4D9ERM9_9SAUR|nr:calcitonin receptor [Platysternon megacephalum]
MLLFSSLLETREEHLNDFLKWPSVGGKGAGLHSLCRDALFTCSVKDTHSQGDSKEMREHQSSQMREAGLLKGLGEGAEFRVVREGRDCNDLNSIHGLTPLSRNHR